MTVRELPKPPPPVEVDPCPWCHENYPCHKTEPRFNRLNCPRVDSMQFLSPELFRLCPKTRKVLWDVEAVSFRSAEQLEVEMEIPSVEDDSEES